MEVPEIDVEALAQLRAGGAAIVDVREPDEYDEAHVPGAALIPLGSVVDRVDEFPSPVYVICRSGARSHQASEFLRAQEIDATNVAGGTLAWIEAGHHVVTGSEPG